MLNFSHKNCIIFIKFILRFFRLIFRLKSGKFFPYHLIHIFLRLIFLERMHGSIFPDSVYMHSFLHTETPVTFCHGGLFCIYLSECEVSGILFLFICRNKVCFAVTLHTCT